MKAAATRGSGITLDRGEELDVTCSVGVQQGMVDAGGELIGL